jgi:hypothetical protein
MQIEGGIIADGIFRRESLIDIDAEPGFFVAPHHAVADFGRAGKDLPEDRAEIRTFLNPEIRGCQIEVHVSGMSHR